MQVYKTLQYVETITCLIASVKFLFCKHRILNNHYRRCCPGTTLSKFSYKAMKANGITTEILSNNAEFNITALFPVGE